MSTESGQKLVIGEQFHQTLTIGDVSTPPSHGLFQPYFPLSEADFLRLQHSSTALAGIGGAIISFGATYGLPKVLESYTATSGASIALSAHDMWITFGTTGFGLLLLVGSYGLCWDRRKILRKVAKHFQDNPAVPRYGR